MATNAQRNEECRADVLEWLALRPGLKFPVASIQTGLKRKGHDYSEEEVAHATTFLSTFGVPLEAGGKEQLLVEQQYSSAFGKTYHYGISAAGTLYYERNS